MPLVNFVSRQMAEAFEPGKGGFRHLISISDPEITPRLKPGWENVLSLRFHDLDGRYVKPQSRGLPPTLEHCDQILRFAEGILPLAGNVLVHCEAGVSRSAATALALEAMGFGLSNRERASGANLYMVEMFGEILGRKIAVPEHQGTALLW